MNIGQDSIRPLGHLESISARVLNLAAQMREISYKLREHADIVHAPVPEENVKSQTTVEQPQGMLAGINANLDEAEAALSVLAFEAGRNTVLV